MLLNVLLRNVCAAVVVAILVVATEVAVLILAVVMGSVVGISTVGSGLGNTQLVGDTPCDSVSLANTMLSKATRKFALTNRASNVNCRTEVNPLTLTKNCS